MVVSFEALSLLPLDECPRFRYFPQKACIPDDTTDLLFGEVERVPSSGANLHHSLPRLGRRRVKEVSRLFVGNLPYKATETDIQSFFSEAGVQVDSVNLMRDRFSGEARGFGFVEINDENLATQAIQACNGRQLMGRALVVNEARPAERRERSDRSFGNEGGGRQQRDFGGSRNRW